MSEAVKIGPSILASDNNRLDDCNEQLVGLMRGDELSVAKALTDEHKIRSVPHSCMCNDGN